ncbi:MAG TPA: autoinducer binding domain-containing protein [Herbaspirillum sp.]|jgi:LuxR family quorum-sensing system transcriptional regulator SolR|nr:autoinducer binding domain-containing protein [Herbaspirillum sp.]
MEKLPFTHIQTLLTAKNKLAVFEILSNLVCELDFDYFSFYLKLPLPVTRPTVIHLHNYPEGWMNHYWQKKYDTVDPTLTRCRNSILPLLWQDLMTSGSKPFWQDVFQHGLRSGMAQPSHGPGGAFGMLNLACTDHRLKADELRSRSLRLSWLAQATSQSMIRILHGNLYGDPHNRLTAREVEVLRWTADGKTASEVGLIMEISERTVNFHVGNSLVKLNATNKTSAVIKAAMLGLL